MSYSSAHNILYTGCATAPIGASPGFGFGLVLLPFGLPLGLFTGVPSGVVPGPALTGPLTALTLLF